MIGAIFTLSFMLVFMLAIAITDLLIFIKQEFDAISSYLSHDTQIFPDYNPNQPST